MRFDILTLFPEMFDSVLGASILNKASERELISINKIDIRDYTKDKHNQADDYPYGGGAGMVMKPEPIFRAVDDLDLEEGTPLIFLTPQVEGWTKRWLRSLLRRRGWPFYVDIMKG